MSQASSSKICKYDVFLSFRGEDTRKNIVSHLYNALQQRGVHTFKDDERLETGKSISDELLKAIEEARFAVIIFSKSYAWSRWCLEELAHIIKCKDEFGQIVIPVFYDVSPSDVRHQNPPFADSFSQHEEKYKDDTEKVQRWRDAFVEAGKLSGYHLPNFKDEAECIKKLFDDIFPKLLQTISPLTERLVGMESQVEKVTSLLDMESTDVRAIGLWGMGGIGKTEIANVLHKRYRHRFEANCFLGNVGDFYKTKGLTWLQQEVICQLLGYKLTLTSEHDGMNILENWLRPKKVLFILDDVNHQKQLEFLVGGLEWFGVGSRIILTAQDKNLIISHVGENVYEVQLLSEAEALELFSWHAFKQKSPEEDFVELSRQVVKHVGGLPLALKVLGSSFKGRGKEHWSGMIDRLKKIPEEDIHGKLCLSFDGLDEDMKEFFLDIVFLRNACFPRGSFDSCLELLYRDKSRDFLIDSLIEKCLLSSGISTGMKMHTMIREMGEHVIRGKVKKGKVKREKVKGKKVISRIWLSEDVYDLFKGKLAIKMVKSLHIPKDCSVVVNDSNIFMKMKSLKVLTVSGNVICGFTDLPSNLQALEWMGYPSDSLPENFEPSQLVLLSLPSSCLVELWPISKKLSNLKHLDLGFSRELTKSPNFGDMPNLERLNLWGCMSLEEVHPSLGQLRMLTYLNLSYCVKLKELPDFEYMESLKSLNLEKCTSLQEFPKICKLMNLQRLSLKRCKKLEKLPENIGDLQELQELDASETAISQPPPSITNLGKLRSLIFSPKERQFRHSSSFSHEEQPFQHSSSFVLNQLSGLSSLVELHLRNHNIWGLPEDLGSLHSLGKLNVSGSNIACLPKSINKLSRLNELNIQFCQNLNELPDELPPNLRELFADYHLALKSIRGVAICRLKLRCLSISDYGAVSTEQANEFLEHYRRKCMQCNFNQRDHCLISFPEVRIPKLFDYQFTNQKEISVDLNSSWYTDKFMGFWISYGPTDLTEGLAATLVCKSDPERKYSLKYHTDERSWLENPTIWCCYIPFERLWRYASGNKEGKNPNDYYMLELTQWLLNDNKQVCWGVRLEYEKEAMTDIGHQKKRRKQ